MFHTQFTPIPYQIRTSTSSIPGYPATNLLIHDPTNPSSRWSTSASASDQSVTLSLRPSVLTTISFGKYCKVHVCNVKDLKVMSGSTEILRCSLRNDSETETFNLRYTLENTFLITSEISIHPLTSWGVNFNFSLWFVELRGIGEIEKFVEFNSFYCERKAYQLVKKYLEGKKDEKEEDEELIDEDELMDEYLRRFNGNVDNDKNKTSSISDKTKNIIENIDESKNTDKNKNVDKTSILDKTKNIDKTKNSIIMTNLFENDLKITESLKILINRKKYDEIEKMMVFLAKNGCFAEHLERQRYVAEWKKIEERGLWPCRRGGHQKVALGGRLLLYGGWTGDEELGDFFEFDPARSAWTALPTENGPGRRSCHKMTVVDGRAYLFGKYVSVESQKYAECGPREIYVFDGKWTKMKFLHGPVNLFDHQIVGNNACDGFSSEFSYIRDYMVSNYCSSLKDNESIGDNIGVNIGDDVDKSISYESIGYDVDYVDKNIVDYVDKNIRDDDNGLDGIDKCIGIIDSIVKDNDYINNNINNLSTTNTSTNTTNSNTTTNSNSNTTTNTPNSNNKKLILYIFGGRPQNDQQQYSGLYKYENGKMKIIRSNGVQVENSPELRSRVGHSMVFIPPGCFAGSGKFFNLEIYNGCLVVVGGQRGKENFREMIFYKIGSDTVFKSVKFPFFSEKKVVQRAVLRGHEIVVYFCYCREKDVLDCGLVCVYNLLIDEWIICRCLSSRCFSCRCCGDSRCSGDSDRCVGDRCFRSSDSDSDKCIDNKCVDNKCVGQNTPEPRSAHTFVLCNDKFYLFGGNVGNKRSNELWELRLNKLNLESLIRKIKFVVRKHRFLGIDDKIAALKYLKENVYGLVEHETEGGIYRELCCRKLKNDCVESEFGDEVMMFFGEWMKMPKECVQDFCK